MNSSMSDDLSKDMLARLSQLEMFAAHVADWAGNPLLLIKARAMLDATAHDVAKPTPAEHANGVYDPGCTACREYAEPVMGNPISDPIAKRMEALIRRLLETAGDFLGDHASQHEDSQMLEEARAIVSLLPEPVDADREEAKKIAAEWYNEEAPHIDPLTAAIRRGRALERDSREG